MLLLTWLRYSILLRPWRHFMISLVVFWVCHLKYFSLLGHKKREKKVLCRVITSYLREKKVKPTRKTWNDNSAHVWVEHTLNNTLKCFGNLPLSFVASGNIALATKGCCTMHFYVHGDRFQDIAILWIQTLKPFEPARRWSGKLKNYSAISWRLWPWEIIAGLRADGKSELKHQNIVFF